MKLNFFLIFIIANFYISNAQDDNLLNEKGELRIVDTIELNNYDQKELYSIVNAFLAKDFFNRSNYEKYSDKNEGLIICRGIWFYGKGKWIFYDVEFNVLDQRVVVKLDRFYFEGRYSNRKEIAPLIKANSKYANNRNFNYTRTGQLMIQIREIRNFFINKIKTRCEETD